MREIWKLFKEYSQRGELFKGGGLMTVTFFDDESGSVRDENGDKLFEFGNFKDLKKKLRGRLEEDC